MFFKDKRLDLALILFLLVACFLSDDAAGAYIREGKTVPKFSLVTLDGQKVSSQSLRGKVVLLDFWMPLAKPCIRAIPQLKALAKDMEGEPFVLLSLSPDEDPQRLRKAVEFAGMTWPQGWDERGRIVRGIFGVTTYPAYILIDHEGRILYFAEGRTDQTDAILRERIGAALVAAQGATAETP